jgi:hypothetical protein
MTQPAPLSLLYAPLPEHHDRRTGAEGAARAAHAVLAAFDACCPLTIFRPRRRQTTGGFPLI